MKFSATFEEKVKKAEEQGDRPLVSSYLNPSKVDPKEPVSFALLEEDPNLLENLRRICTRR